MSRSVNKFPYCHNSLRKKIKEVKASGKRNLIIKTRSRSSVIMPDFVGCNFGVYNGKMHVSVSVSEEMVGHKLGEFSPTRTFRGHAGNKKVGKK